MKRILALIGVLAFIPLLGVFLVWFWLTPHKHSMIRRAERGDVQAMYLVGVANLMVHGDGIVEHPNNADAIFWLRKASEKDHVGAMWTISGLGIPNEEKVMWLKKGAELGSEACVIELMNAHRFGLFGLPQDKGAAIYWELKRGELYLKRESKSPEEMKSMLAQWEVRYRKENHYDGPIRPLP